MPNVVRAKKKAIGLFAFGLNSQTRGVKNTENKGETGDFKNGGAKSGALSADIPQHALKPLDVLAQAIADLSAEDRAKLAAMLAQGQTAKD